MKMSKPSQAMVDALKDAKSADGCRVHESAIIGNVPEEGEEGNRSLSLLVLNGRGELTIFPFISAHEVTEFCTSLQSSSDAVFGDGDMQPQLVLDS